MNLKIVKEKTLVLALVSLIIMWGTTITTYATDETLDKDEGYLEINIIVPEDFDTAIKIHLVTEKNNKYLLDLDEKNMYNIIEILPVGKYKVDFIDINDEKKYKIGYSGEEIVIEKGQVTEYGISISILSEENINNLDSPLRKGFEATLTTEPNNEENIDWLEDPYANMYPSEETNPELTIEEKRDEEKPIENREIVERAMDNIGGFFYKFLKKNLVNLIMILIAAIALIIIKQKRKYY